MKQVIPSSKKQKSFGQSLTIDKIQPQKRAAGATKPRAIKTPGGRSGLKKGAGG